MGYNPLLGIIQWVITLVPAYIIAQLVINHVGTDNVAHSVITLYS